jgi:hypothetical protein
LLGILGLLGGTGGLPDLLVVALNHPAPGNRESVLLNVSFFGPILPIRCRLRITRQTVRPSRLGPYVRVNPWCIKKTA